MKSFFRNLFAPCRTPAARRPAPRLEALEGREVPAVSVMSLTGGELKITGTGAGDKVYITQDDNANSLKIVSQNDNKTWTYSSSSVKKVSGDLGAGNDYLSWNLTGASKYAKEVDMKFSSGDDDVNLFLSGTTIRADMTFYLDMGSNDDYASATLGHIHDAYVHIYANLGSGDDTAWMNLKGDIYNHGTVSFAVEGSYGKDDIKAKVGDPFFGDGVSEIGANANLIVNFDGGTGDDTIKMDIAAELDGDLLMMAYGRDGNDTIGVDVLLKTGSGGTVEGYLYGMGDNDIIGAQVRKESGVYATVAVQANGGLGTDGSGNDGWDSGYSGAGVTKSNFDYSTIIWNF